MSRIAGIAAGIATHALFAYTVWHLFWFLKGNVTHQSAHWVWADAALALQFAVPHSILLLPASRRRLSQIVGPAFYGLIFCVVTCLSLLLLFAGWQSSTTPFWALTGGGQFVVEVAFLGSWVSLLYSISLTGLGYQTGWTPWWFWLRGRQPPRREFHPRSVYRWIRHPVYLSFLGLIWFNPTMTMDRFMLAGIWTVYILIGSYLKDERLAFYLGSRYRDYQTRVTGFPLFFRGPLAKRRPATATRLESRPAALDKPSSRMAA